MLQYNLLSVVKRFMAYETIGELFRSANAETIELTVNERIRQVVIEIVIELAEIFETDFEILLEKIFSKNEKIVKMLNYKTLLQAG